MSKDQKISRVLVVFGSSSDSSIYNNILSELEQSDNFVTEFKVLSAHRNPTELGELIRSAHYDFIIAGAGLAAHLPGVIASITEKVVIGVPIAAHMGGMDATLSIVQMPKGVPVLSTAPTTSLESVKFLNSLKKYQFNKINVVANGVDLQEFLIEDYGISINVSERIYEDFLNIIVVPLDRYSDVDFCIDKDGVKIYMPFVSAASKKDIQTALTLFTVMERGGVWVGLNNFKNAIISCKKLGVC